MQNRLITSIICLAAGMIVFEAPCLATTYNCGVDEIRTADRYDAMFEYLAETPSDLNHIRLMASIYARVKITSKVKVNSDEMEVRYSVLDLVNFSRLQNQPPKAGVFKYSFKKPSQDRDEEGFLVNPCGESQQHESLTVGREYIFGLSLDERSNEFIIPDPIFFWSGMAKQSLEYLKFFADLGRLKPDDLVKNIRSLLLKDSKKALIALSLFEEKIPPQLLRNLGSQVFLANGHLWASYRILTTIDAAKIAPNADNHFMAMQVAIRLDDSEEALKSLKNFLLLLGLEKKTPQMTPSSIDLKYWKSFIASPSFQFLKKDPKQLQAIVQEWINLRTCGVTLSDAHPRVAWSKELDPNRAVVACKNPPSGTVIWLSSLPLAANQNPESSIIISKPYYLLRDPDLEKASLIGVTSFAKSREQEDWVLTRKRVLNYTYSCPTSQCKLNVACALDRSQRARIQALPITSKDAISNLENSFFKMLYSLTTDFNMFSRVLTKVGKINEDSEPYLSLAGYSQMLKDVRSFCKM
jgi:hypothetical protein